MISITVTFWTPELYSLFVYRFLYKFRLQASIGQISRVWHTSDHIPITLKGASFLSKFCSFQCYCTDDRLKLIARNFSIFKCINILGKMNHFVRIWTQKWKTTNNFIIHKSFEKNVPEKPSNFKDILTSSYVKEKKNFEMDYKNSFAIALSTGQWMSENVRAKNFNNLKKKCN